MSLQEYRRKRDFKITREPKPSTIKKKKKEGRGALFVIQKHAASHLHYDLRLEIGGALASWALPKGPSLDPLDKRLAVQVEDHPLSYATFEGTIPEGEYGAGEVLVWDTGSWKLVDGELSPEKALKKGKLKIELTGKKLKGLWNLFRINTKSVQHHWLFVKERDQFARPQSEYDLLVRAPKSVLSKNKRFKKL